MFNIFSITLKCVLSLLLIIILKNVVKIILSKTSLPTSFTTFGLCSLLREIMGKINVFLL